MPKAILREVVRPLLRPLVKRMPALAPATGVRVVTPLQFGATGSMDDDDSAAIQAALDSGHRVLIDRPYRHLSKLIWPAYTHILTTDPVQSCLVADMGTGLSDEIGGGLVIEGPGLRFKSLAYQASSLANNANWDLFARTPRLVGGDARISAIYLEDLAGGLDVDDESNILIEYIHGKNLRTRYGWGSVLHAHGSLGGEVVLAEAEDCDRFMEPEDGSKNWTFHGGDVSRIYPPGYTGQPADGTGSTSYDTGSFILSAHSHSGEGGCDNIVYRNFTVRESLGAVRVERSGSSDPADLCTNITFENITVESPKRVNRSAFGGGAAINFTPFHLQGGEVDVLGCRITGTGESQISRIVHAVAGGENINIDDFTADANSYHGRLVQLAAPNSTFQNSTVGQQAGSSTAVLIDVDANGCKVLNNELNGPKYHSYLYDFASGTSGCERKGNSYTPPASNPPAAIVNYNGTTVDETGGNDDA